jgi:hypothetical protein
MPPFLSSPNATIDSGDIQDAVDAYLAANPLDLTAHLAAADPHTGYQLESQRGVANGYASLNGSAVLPDNQIPSTIARDTEIVTQISTHAAATDPHADRAFTTSSISTHNADTTSVHGIADTSALETTTGSTAKVAAHAALTTAAHGIADTSALVTNSNTKLWPQKVTVTSDQTEPSAPANGDFWIAPAI